MEIIKSIQNEINYNLENLDLNNLINNKDFKIIDLNL